MIDTTDALEVFHINIARTNALIGVMEKIKAYNWLYQQEETKRDPAFGNVVAGVQDAELMRIELACAEHAIISLATTFETYYRELVHEVLATNPSFFLRQQTEFSIRLNSMLQDEVSHTYEQVEDKLNLQGKTRYKSFFREYNVPFIINDVENNLIEYIYVQRNYFVHNVSRPDSKKDKSLVKIVRPVKEPALTTEAKRLRTSISKLIPKIDQRVKKAVFS